MFLDVKELAVHKLRIRKTYAPRNCWKGRFASTATSKQRSNWYARAAWSPWWKR